jgi:hypothetical protein
MEPEPCCVVESEPCDFICNMRNTTFAYTLFLSLLHAGSQSDVVLRNRSRAIALKRSRAVT